jgi:hypothetical protein
VKHSQRKRGATDRSTLRSLASVLDPTLREGNGNVGFMRSPLRAIALPDQSSGFSQSNDFGLLALNPVGVMRNSQSALVASQNSLPDSHWSVCILERL